ncbi:hypothetical protein [Streptomyces sp. NPDC054865]
MRGRRTEIRYQFTRPFVVDASAYEAAFEVRATPFDQQVKATVDWWRERPAGAAVRP